MLNKYIYEGPVTQFGVCIQNNWKAETWAVSEDKARNNLCYRFKKQNGIKPGGTPIKLPGTIKKIF